MSQRSMIPFATLFLPLIASCRVSNATPAAEHEQSVNPGVNRSYLANPDVARYIERFERDQREVYVQRDAIVADVGAARGAALADIGCGTGFFSLLFAKALGPEGTVFAVDIAPGFLELTEQRARDGDLANIKTVLCKEDSVELAAESIDLAFMCDTYHHFEYPRSTMTSLHRALKPAGELVVVDFKRVEGESDDWTLNHVRAGQAAVIREITSYGFEFVSDATPTAQLAENYFLRFRKKD